MTVKTFGDKHVHTIFQKAMLCCKPIGGVEVRENVRKFINRWFNET